MDTWGFAINNDTNTDGDTNNTTAHPLCSWSYLRKIMNTTRTHLSRRTHAMDIRTYLTHWHTQTSLRRPGSLGPLIHSQL